MSSGPGSKPPEQSTSQAFFYIHVYKSPQLIRYTGGSAKESLLGPKEKPLNQPKPHPSDKTV